MGDSGSYHFSAKAVESVPDIIRRANSPSLHDRIGVLEQLVVRDVGSDVWLYRYAYELPAEDYRAAASSVLEGGLFTLEDSEKVRDVFGKITQAAIQFKLSSLLSEIVMFLEYDDPIVQIQALRTLGQLKAKRYAKEIAKVASSPNIDVSRPALRILMKFDSKEAVPVLISCLKKEENFGIKMNAIEALGRIGDRSAIPHLIPLLKTKLHPWTIDTLVSLDAKEAAPYIKELYESGQEDDHRLLTSLAYFGDDQAISEIMTKMIDDESLEFVGLLERLIQIKAQPVIPALIKVLEEEEAVGGHNSRGPNVIRYIMTSLAKLQANEAIPVLRLYLKPQSGHSSVDGFLTSGAIEALSMLKDKQTMQQLLQMLDSSDYLRWSDATMALARIGEPSTIESLIVALMKRQPNAHHVKVLSQLAFTLNPNTYEALLTKLPRLESLPLEEYLTQLNKKGDVTFSLSENIPLPDGIKSRIVSGFSSPPALSALNRILRGVLNYSGHKYTIFIDDGVVRFVTIEEAYDLWENWVAEYKNHPEQ